MRVQAYDNSVHDFPDDMPQAKIDSAMKDYTQEAHANEWAKGFWSDKGSQLAADTREYYMGRTWGAGDKIAAGVSYLGTSMANLALQAMGEKPDFTAEQAYKATLQNIESESAAFEKEHPAQAFASNLVGGLKAPGLGKLAKWTDAATTVGGKIGRVAAAGAGAGFAGGAAEGDYGAWDRFYNGLWGVPIGVAASLLGHGAAHTIAEHGTKLLHAGGDIVRNAVIYLSGKTPEELQRTLSPAEVRKWEDKAIEFSQRRLEEAKKTPTQDRAHQLGMPITAAEAGGQEGLLIGLARTGGETGEQVATQMRQRSEARPMRVMEHVRHAFGIAPEDVEANYERQEASGRARNAHLYERAHAHDPPEARLENNPTLSRLVPRPSMQAGLRHAVNLAQEEGEDPFQIGLHHETQPETRTDILGRTTTENVPTEVRIASPTMKTWDYIRRGIDQWLRNPANQTPAAFETRRVLSDELKRISDPYRQAVEAGGETIGLRNAHEDGASMMGPGVGQHQFEGWWNGLTAAERRAAQGGMVMDIRRIVNAKTPGRLNLDHMRSPQYLAKLETMLGRERAGLLKEQLDQEARMKAFESRVPASANSVTSTATQAMKEIEDAELPGAEQLVKDLKGGLISTGRKYLVDQLIAPLLGARTPFSSEFRNALGRLQRLSPSQLEERIADWARRSEAQGAPPLRDKYQAKALDILRATGQRAIPLAAAKAAAVLPAETQQSQNPQ